MLYTHPCSVIAARWVPDNLLRSELRLAGSILSAGIELHTFTPLINGFPPLLNHWGHWARRYDVSLWLQEYFITLSDVYNSVHRTKHDYSQFLSECKTLSKMLSGEFVEPSIAWLPIYCQKESTLSSFRAYLGTQSPQYRRVRPPLWWSRRSFTLYNDGI